MKNLLAVFPMLQRTSTLQVIALALIVGAGISKAIAQTYLDATGSPNFSTTIPVENGFINVSNGNLHLEFALNEPVQRGKVAVNSKLIYDSRIWQVAAGTSWQTRQNYTTDKTLVTTGGWRYSNAFGGNIFFTDTPYYCHIISSQGQSPPVILEQGHTQGPYFWLDPQGTEHQFNAYLYLSPTMNPVPPTTCTYTTGGGNGENYTTSADAGAQDGSGLHLYVSYSGNKVVVLDKSGNQVCCGTIQDTNGNPISFSAGSGSSPATITDTNKRQPIVFSNDGNGHYYFDVPSFGGATPNRYIVTTESINVSTQFNQAGVTEYSAKPLTVIQSIQLPGSGGSYQFQYDTGTTPGHYGELTQMTLPGGGEVVYGYGLFTDANQNVNHWVTSRQTSDGTSSYIPTVISQCSSTVVTGCQQKVVVTPPDRNDTIYTSTLNYGAWNTHKDAWAGSSTISGQGYALVSTSSAYTWVYPSGSVLQGYATKRTDTTTLDDVNQSHSTEYDYDSSTGATLTARKDFDYTPCSNGKPTIETDYVYDPRAGFVAANILDHVQSA